jgi:hypothetical protein
LSNELCDNSGVTPCVEHRPRVRPLFLRDIRILWACLRKEPLTPGAEFLGRH